MKNAYPLRVAFYRAEFGELDDKIIDKGSGGLGYSHCEVVIDAKTMIGAHYLAGGVNTFHYNDIYSSKYWDIYEIDVNAIRGQLYAKQCIGVGYDAVGVILDFIKLPFYVNHDKTWCSKFTAVVVNKAYDPKGLDTLIDDVSLMPNEFLTFITEVLDAKQINRLNAKRNRTFKDRPAEVDRFGRIQ